MKWLNDYHKKMMVVDVRLYMVMTTLFLLILSLPAMGKTSFININLYNDPDAMSLPIYEIIFTVILSIGTFLISTAIKCFFYFGIPTLILHRVFKEVNPFTRMTISVAISVCIFALIFMIDEGLGISIYDIYSTVIIGGIVFYTYSLFTIRKGIPPLVAVTTQNVFVILLIGFAKLLMLS